MLKAIIFDMDGVITLTMPFHFRAWQRVFADRGIHVSEFEVYSREGQKGIQSVLEIFKKYNKTVTESEAKKILESKEKIFKSTAKTPFVPYARRFIRKYHGKGIKLALVTGTARHEIDKILPKDILGCFEVVVSGSDVRHGKPHPEPYQMAVKALKVKKSEAVVIENAPFGITSAVKAGLHCIALETSLPKNYLTGADYIVGDFKSLEIYIKRRYTL